MEPGSRVFDTHVWKVASSLHTALRLCGVIEMKYLRYLIDIELFRYRML